MGKQYQKHCNAKKAKRFTKNFCMRNHYTFTDFSAGQVSHIALVRF